MPDLSDASATPSNRAVLPWPRALFAIALLFTQTSCHTTHPPPALPLPAQTPAETRTPTRVVIDPSDGCSHAEAEFFARRFYEMKFGSDMEGGLVDGGETKTHWVFHVISGFAAVHDGDILVAKQTGIARYQRR